MNIKSFVIKNYRAIKEIEISLKHPIIPIIGINESGKTSILQAILAFDFRRDKYNSGEHLNYQNIYSTDETTDSSISAKLTLFEEEIKEMLTTINIKPDSDDYSIIKKISTKTDLIFTRKLSSEYKYEYINSELTDDITYKVAEFLKNKFPFILYFDDFTDRVPEDITFPPKYHQTGELTKGKAREWQEIIEEIFKKERKTQDTQKPLQKYISMIKSDTKKDILSDIQDFLNKEIIEEWKKLKKRCLKLADDSENLELSLENPDSQEKFQFKVKDRSSQNKSRTFTINRRSKGFQWFFNYMAKLKFNPHYRDVLENALFLLDEPGSYLHSSAQIELLETLKRVSEKNKVIFCTHSQFLLSPKTIKLGSIKIAHKEKAIIKIFNYGDYPSSESRGALSPIYQALELNFAHDFVGKVIILEGINDFYFFELLKRQQHINGDIKFIPGSGAENSEVLISVAIAFADDYLVLLDNDEDGKKAKDRYIGYFGELVEKKIFFYHRNKNFKLESFFTEENKKELKSLSSSGIKKALALLYYSKDDKSENFVKNLVEENTQLDFIVRKINKLIS